VKHRAEYTFDGKDINKKRNGKAERIVRESERKKQRNEGKLKECKLTALQNLSAVDGYSQDIYRAVLSVLSRDMYQKESVFKECSAFCESVIGRGIALHSGTKHFYLTVLNCMQGFSFQLCMVLPTGNF
jgi:hypothetical protein